MGHPPSAKPNRRLRHVLAPLRQDLLPARPLCRLHTGSALWRGITHLHLTGIVLGISAETRAAAIALLDAAEARGLPVSFDPNLRLNLWPSVDDLRTALNAVAGRATILLPGLAEARLLTGLTEPAAIADHYLAGGAAEVVVKLGREGAQTWTTRETARSRSFDVRPVDTVGAGDGFAAG